MTDPREADTLDEAARDPDGTYNGTRALSWLSDVLTGGKGMSEAEIREIFEDVRATQGSIFRDGDSVDAGMHDIEQSIEAGSRRTAHRFRL